MEDYYKILGVQKGATDREIKSAYRKLAVQWHPDKNKSADAEKKFKEINSAYAVLSDSKKREQYDQFGHAAFQQGAGGGGGNPFGQGNPFGGQQFTYTYGGGDGQNPFGDFGGDPFQIFEQFFGGANPFGQQARRMPRYQIDISLHEAFSGTEKQISIDNQKRKIKIPQGVETGSQIRFDDFAIVINVEQDKNFQREGNDLIATINIPIYTAVSGGEIEIPMIEGKTKIRIRPGTQAGSVLRISGRGMPILNTRGHGDFYIKLNVEIPSIKDLSREQKEAIEKLKR